MSKHVLHFKNETIQNYLKVWAFKDIHLNYTEIHPCGPADAISWFYCGRCLLLWRDGLVVFPCSLSDSRTGSYLHASEGCNCHPVHLHGHEWCTPVCLCLIGAGVIQR